MSGVETPLDIVALIGAISHDVDHPGYNNTYASNKLDKLAITYNDVAILGIFYIIQ